MLSEKEKIALLLDKKYFIEKGTNATYFQWMRSKGTNFTCYEQYMDSLSEQDILNNKIETVRIIIYALQRPITFISLGNVLDKLGDLYKYYFTNENLYDGDILLKTRCKNDEMSPMKWFITRQVCSVLWYVGEIIGDWYPLLRTHAILKRNKAILAVYITCGLFNLSKVALIMLHLGYSAGSLFNKDGAFDHVKSSRFYSTYSILQLIIIYTSFFYDIAVYIVLKKCIFYKQQYDHGFLKKFKNLSEYRMLISAFVSAIFLPIISFTIILKIYYQKKRNFYELDFTFEETRMMVTNVQYYMIFIDQILLVRFKDESSASNSKNNSNSNMYYSSGSHNFSNNSKSKFHLSKMNSFSQSDTLKSDSNYMSEFSSTFNMSNNNSKSKYPYNNMNSLSRSEIIKNNNENIIESQNEQEDINIDRYTTISTKRLKITYNFPKKQNNSNVEDNKNPKTIIANINFKDENGITALMVAEEIGKEGVLLINNGARLLLEKGINVDAENVFREKALIENGYTKIALSLINNHADINVCDTDKILY
ncbi:hypothetical protein PIROE2DRAFT_17551 [Piromyces sp. E2]|nr:hypothetical protein PIROE2DRAFT_17551 [Piromyces sp. E2]|eukprot:OUM57466.1 hypothetical protein PIROE2DRAFT_17551 [Piromyces sp. E2]